MDWKLIVQQRLLKMGYAVYRVGSGNPYSLCPPYDYWTYSPWFESWFQEIYAKVKDRTMVKEDRCYVIYEFCRHCLHFEGDFAECGVYKGGSAFLIASTLVNSPASGKGVHLFDTFRGMPAIANDDPSGVKEGQFGDTSLTAVKNYLSVFPNVSFHPGVIPETFDAVKENRFAFVHVDVDLYQTAKDCCEFFYGRMVPGGIMIFDDYGFVHFRYSAKRAVDEFFAGKPETPITLRTGQCLIIKL
jgi:O-methyltransferase